MAGCFEDSCSVKFGEVTTTTGRKYQATLDLADNGSIVCDEDSNTLGVGDGLFVDLLNDVPIDTTRQCANTLRRTSAGELYSVLPQVVQTTLASGSFQNVPAGADASSPAPAPQSFQYFNDTDCEVMIVITGQFNLGYEVLTRTNATPAIGGSLQRITNITTNANLAPSVLTANLIPFNAQWIARLRRQVTGASPVALGSVIADHFSTSGVAVDPTPNNVIKSEWRDFTWIQQLGANSTIIFTADVFHDGPDQTVNVATSGGDVNTGFRLHNCDMFALPLQVI